MQGPRGYPGRDGLQGPPGPPGRVIYKDDNSEQGKVQGKFTIKKT